MTSAGLVQVAANPWLSWDYVVRNRADLTHALEQHTTLTIQAVLIAFVIALPLAALAHTRHPWRLMLDADEWIADRDHAATVLDRVRQLAPTFIGAIDVCDVVEGTEELNVDALGVPLPRLIPRQVEFVGRIHEQPATDLKLVRLELLVGHDGYTTTAKDRKGARNGLILTVLLGVMFTAIQAYEYSHIFQHKYFFSEEAANAGLYGSSFIMATGFHGFHVLIGTIFLTVCLIRLMGGGFTPQKHFGFEAAAWYWHFVDVVWLFLFAFVYVIFGAHGGA